MTSAHRELDQTEVETLLDRLDGTGSNTEWEAALQLRSLGSDLPRLLLQRFRSARSWKVRSSCVYHAVRYSLESRDAVILGLEAIRDRSKVVRYRGAMLLAYAQDPTTVAPIRTALAEMSGTQRTDDLLAAIDAIENKNHNYFVDRDHTGKLTLTVE